MRNKWIETECCHLALLLLLITRSSSDRSRLEPWNKIAETSFTREPRGVYQKSLAFPRRFGRMLLNQRIHMHQCLLVLRGGQSGYEDSRPWKKRSSNKSKAERTLEEMEQRKKRWKEQFPSSNGDLSSERGFSDQPDIYKPPLQTEPDDVSVPHCSLSQLQIAASATSSNVEGLLRRTNRKRRGCPTGWTPFTTRMTPRNSCRPSSAPPPNRRRQPRPPWTASFSTSTRFTAAATPLQIIARVRFECGLANSLPPMSSSNQCAEQVNVDEETWEVRVKTRRLPGTVEDMDTEKEFTFSEIEEVSAGPGPSRGPSAVPRRTGSCREPAVRTASHACKSRVGRARSESNSSQPSEYSIPVLDPSPPSESSI